MPPIFSIVILALYLPCKVYLRIEARQEHAEHTI